MRKEISVYIGEKGVQNFIFTDLDFVDNSKEAIRNFYLKRPFYYQTDFGYCCGFFVTDSGNYSQRAYKREAKGFWIIKVSKPSRSLVLCDYYSQFGFVQNTLYFAFAITRNG